MLLMSDGWYTIGKMFETLIPISICVVLPLIIIALVLRNRRHEVDKKTELMMKAIENGATLDPAFFQPTSCCRMKTVKDKLMGWLLAGCITTGLGVMLGVVLAFALSSSGILQSDPSSALLFIIPAVLIGIGISFFIVYFIGKNKTWKKELAELDAKKSEEQAL